MNGVVIGSGAMLLGCKAAAPAIGPNEAAVHPWTGYAGIGDYARSNGNTRAVIDAAHQVRDGAYEDAPRNVEEEPTLYDLIVVGGGFSGLNAAHELRRKRGTNGRCLILENHPMFGGEAKQNEFLVDGHHLYGPQGSNDFLVPTGSNYHARLWQELGLPTSYEFARPAPGTPKAPFDNFGPMYWEPEQGPLGYRFGDTWVVDAAKDGFARAPIDPSLRRDLARLWTMRTPHRAIPDVERWLDGMTYRDLLLKELGFSDGVLPFVDPLLASSDYGFGSDVISAYAACRASLPGARAFSRNADEGGAPSLLSFPGGNAAIARHAVKSLLPDAFAGSGFAEILEQPVHFDALDQRGSSTRLRLGSTVVRVEHVAGDRVAVTYAKNGRLHRAFARGVVMASGGWITRRVVRDMPEPLADAYSQFHYGPMLVVNVALRNWHFLDRLGFTSARWFDGFGFFANIRRPMIVGGKSAPFAPDKPIVLTFYIPYAKAGGDIASQGAIARTTLFEQQYADIERLIRQQMTDLFASGGFDAARDIAGIVLNRWGHAYIAPQPGFQFGKDGGPSPLEIVRAGHDRIAFGHSDTAGQQNWWNAVEQGARAAGQVIA